MGPAWQAVSFPVLIRSVFQHHLGLNGVFKFCMVAEIIITGDEHLQPNLAKQRAPDLSGI